MSYHTFSTKPLNASLQALLKRGGHIGLGLGAFAPVLALANPTGGQVVAGSATINTPGANDTVVKQSSQSAIIDWQQFNIGSGQYVQFLQPSSSSVILNRVVGGGSSSIYGTLTGNGQVFLVNTNGVFFGQGASIDTQGFLASTLDISDRNFMTGHYVFDQPGAPGAKVVNQGNITAHKGGYVVLAGDYAENDGLIAAQSGHVVLASGAKATLSLRGNNLVNFAVDQATLAAYAGVKNAGSLVADGGTVIMTADVANALKATVVNNVGLVQAHAISNQGGAIYLTASGGNIENAGTLDADGAFKGQAGGQIVLKGDGRTTLSSTSKIDALGQNGARGGSVEVSGESIGVRGTMSLGQGGNLLLDPNKITLVDSNGGGSHLGSNGSGEGSSVNVGVGFIETQLNAGANVAVSAHNFISASADIDAAGITATGKGTLKFKTSPTGHINLGGVDITIGGKLTASAGYASFGHLTAGSMDLEITSNLQMEVATSDGHGVITKNSAKTTVGSLIINAASIGLHGGGTGEDGLALLAKTGLQLGAAIGHASAHFGSNVTLQGASVTDTQGIFDNAHVKVSATAGPMTLTSVTGNEGVVLTDAGGDMTIQDVHAASGDISITDTKGAVNINGSGSAVVQGRNVSITAKTIQTNVTGTLNLEASTEGGDLTIKGIFGATPTAGLQHGLLLEGTNISVNNNIKAKSVDIEGNTLAYTGKNNTFSISGTNGDLTLNANIGSAESAVKYNVTLLDKHHHLNVEKSIFTGFTASGAAANITATETFGSSVGGGSQGVFVGASSGEVVTTIDLSAKGNVSLTGANVFVGRDHFGNDHAAVDITGKNVSVTASGVRGSSGYAVVMGGSASIGNGKHDASTKLTATTGNLSLTGQEVWIFGGFARANLSGGYASASDVANVSLTATKGNVTLKGTGAADVRFEAGSVEGGIDVGSAGTHTVNAQADADITAGKAITITGERVEIGNGAVQDVFAIASHAGDNNAVTAGAKTSLTAGTSITVSGGADSSGSVIIEGGHSVARGLQVVGSGVGAIASLDADAGVSLVAQKGGIAVSARSINVSAGYAAATRFSSSAANADVRADGAGAKAAATVNANVDFTAGSGGISLTAKGTGGGEMNIQGGRYAGSQQAVAASSGATALSSVNARVDLLTTGALAIGATDELVIQGGRNTGWGAGAGARSAIANVAADAGVALTAKSISITADSMTLHAGSQGAFRAIASASGSGASAGVTTHADLALTATGALTIAASGELGIHGGFSAGMQGEAFARFATANVEADAGVKLTAKSVSITADQMQLHAGSKGAFRAFASASGSDASAGVTTHADLALTATGGNVSVRGHLIGIDAGYGLAGGSLTDGSSTTFQHLGGSGGNSSSAKTVYHNRLQGVNASAGGLGATATVSATGGISIAATGAIAIQGTGEVGIVVVDGGGGGAFGALAHAGTGATAAVSVKDGVTLTAGGALTLTGKHVNLLGGGSQGEGISGSSSIEHFIVHCTTGSGCHQSPGASTEHNPHRDTAHGHGALSQISVDGSLHLTGAAVTVAAADGLAIFAGFNNGADAQLSAGGGGIVSETVKGGVGITATTGAITLGAGSGGATIVGGVAAADRAQAHAGSLGAVDLSVDAGLDFNAVSMTVTAGEHITLVGGGSAGYGAQAVTQDASATVTADSAVHVTTSKSFTAKLTGSSAEGGIFLGAGRDAAADADAFGSASGQAAVTGHGGISIDVTGTGGTITLDTGKHVNADIELFGSSSAARFAGGFAAGTKGTADVTAATDLSLSAKGLVTLHAGGDVSLSGGSEDQLSDAEAGAVFGGKTHISASSNLSINGGGIVITAGRDVLMRGGGSGNGRHIHANAGSSGSVDFVSDTNLSITATGALTVTAGRDLRIGAAGSEAGESDRAFAGSSSSRVKNAKAAIDVESNVTLSGNTALSLSAKRNLDIRGSASGSGAGSYAGASAASRDVATVTAHTDVSLLTKGAFTAAAGSFLSIEGNRDVAYGAQAMASGARGQATVDAGGTITLSGASVTLQAGKGLAIEGGSWAGGNSNSNQTNIAGKNGGNATIDAAAGVSITAVNAFAARLTGVVASDSIFIGAGSQTGRSANLVAAGNGHATLDADAGVDINVTGKNGTLTLNTGNNNVDAEVYGGREMATDLRAAASGGGIVAATATGGVTLKAAGAIAITAAKDQVSISAGSEMAQDARLHADHGGRASLTANGDVDIIGAALTLTGASVRVDGGFDDVADSLELNAGAGGSVAATVGGSAKLQALTGGITITATTGNVSMLAAGERDGHQMSFTASGANAKATGTVDDDISLTAAGNVSVTAVKGNVFIAAGGSSSIGKSFDVFGSNGGKATGTFDAKIAINAGGAFIAKAAGALILAGGASSIGSRTSVAAEDARANASLTEDASLTINARSITASGGSLQVAGGANIGRFGSVFAFNGGVANLNVKGGVTLNATGGSISLRGKQRAGVFGGRVAYGSSQQSFQSGNFSPSSNAGSVTHSSGFRVVSARAVAFGNGASAKFTADGSVNLTATGAITIAETSTGASGSRVIIAAGNSAGSRAVVAAGGGGSASISAKAGVSLTAGGALTVTGKDVKIIGGNGAGIGAGHGSRNVTHSFCSSGCSPTSTSHSSPGNPLQATGRNSRADLNVSAGVTIDAAAVTLVATKDMMLDAGGVQAGSRASVQAVSSGSAAVSIHTGLKVTTPGAFVATAGSNLRLTANSASTGGSSRGGNLGHSAFVQATSSGAHADLSITNDVQIDAKSVALRATKGSLSIIGGNSVGFSIDMHADRQGDQATAELSGKVSIDAATTLSLTGNEIFVVSGRSAAGNANIEITSTSGTAAAFSSISLDANDSVSLTAGTTLTVKATDQLGIFAGAFGAESAELFASGSSVHATATVDSGVDLKAATIVATAGNDINIDAGFEFGSGAAVIGRDGGKAELDIGAGVSIAATGAVAIASAKGNVAISACYGDFIFCGARASASTGGSATLNEDFDTSITAGTTLTVTAAKDVLVAGGSGLWASIDATRSTSGDMGTARANVSGVTSLQAGTNLSVTAGGNLQVLGGSANGMAINLFPSSGFNFSLGSVPPGPAGGRASGELAAGVSLTAAGDVNLKAGKDLTVAAGAGVTLAVGMTRVGFHTPTSGAVIQGFLGAGWGGGSADLTADVSATVHAGHNLNLTAGTTGAGDLQVLGLRQDPDHSVGPFSFFNVAAVRTGSSGASANVSLVGNATLTAANDITLNARGNASIIGGSLATLRADHTRGNVTITGSADATLHAGHDVVLNNITGSLTVAGINVNSSHTGQVFVDAFGSTGHAVVTGHADAAISAGNDVRTVTTLGKSLNVVGGNFVKVVALGSSGEVGNFATGTANAGIDAGRNITVVAKGDLNVLGGEGALASASATGQSTATTSGHSAGDHFGTRVAKVRATAGIAAQGAVSINAAGSGVVAAGDGLKSAVNFRLKGSDSTPSSITAPVVLADFGSGQASGDVSASITSGTTMSLTVGHSLLVRGGSSVNASAQAFFAGGTRAQATGNANVSLVSGGNMTITVGLTTHGDASFNAGSSAKADTVFLGQSGSAQATTDVGMTLQAGGNLTMNVGGGLKVLGGPSTGIGSFLGTHSGSPSFGPGAIAIGQNVTAKTAVLAHATVTAAGNLTVTQHGGNATIEAGSSVGVLHSIVAASGSGASADYTADAGVTVHAGGAIKLTGETSVGLFAGNNFPSAFILIGSSGPATATAISSVKISGKTVNINNGHGVSTASFGTFNSGGLKLDATLTVTATSAPTVPVFPLEGFAPHSVTPSQHSGTLQLVQPMSLMSGSSAAPAALWTTPVSSTQGALQLQGHAATLGLLQDHALVMSLVTVAAQAQAKPQALIQPTLFVPVGLAAGHAASFADGCSASVLSDDGASRYRVGGR